MDQLKMSLTVHTVLSEYFGDTLDRCVSEHTHTFRKPLKYAPVGDTLN